MKTYRVILSYDVPYQCSIDIEADSPEQAERAALAQLGDIDEGAFEPVFDGSGTTEVADVIEILEGKR